MSRFGKFTVSAVLIAPLILGGCRPTKGTASPQDYFPLIQVAMAGGETGAMIGRNEAIKAKNFAGCVASEALIVAFDSSNAVLAGRMADKIVIPAVEIDVSDCLALREAPAEEAPAEEAPAEEAPAEEAPAEEAPAEEAPAEEAPAEEVTPAAEEPAAEEPAAEEPAAEEAPAEDPVVEEPIEEEPADEEDAEAEPVEMTLAASNSEAAMLVEMVAGITMAAVLHYAVKLQAANCKKGTAALGAINYVNGMIKPIADEIANPDGKISVPAVAIDLSECSES